MHGSRTDDSILTSSSAVTARKHAQDPPSSQAQTHHAINSVANSLKILDPRAFVQMSAKFSADLHQCALTIRDAIASSKNNITDLIIGLSPSRIFRQDKRVYPIMALPEFGERQFSNPNVPVYSCTCQVVPWLLSIESPFTGNMMLSVFAVVRPGCILPVPYA